MKKLIKFICVIIFVATFFTFYNRCCLRKACRAIENNDLEQLESILQTTPNLNATTYSPILLPVIILMDADIYTTPLNTACANGNGEAVRLLLNHGANPDYEFILGDLCTDVVYYSPRSRSARFDIIPQLLAKSRKSNVSDMATSVVFNELKYATNDNASETIDLIRRCIDYNCKITDKNEQSLLILYCRRNSLSLEVVTYLIGLCDINWVDNQGKTALDYAIYNKNDELVDLLCAYGAERR